MLLMGDEVRRTQQGNNNAYCQDNEISWFDWNLCHRNADLLRFVRNVIRLRLNFNRGTKAGQITLEDYLSKARIEWHGVQLGKPDWGRNSHSVALTLHNIAVSQVRYIAINAYWQPLEFELPLVKGGSDAAWLRLIDTSLASPEDISEAGGGSVVAGASYLVNPRSIVMLHYDDAIKGQAAIH